MNGSDAQLLTLPSLATRLAKLQDPGSGDSSTGRASVTEAAFASTSSNLAQEISNPVSKMGSRNDLLRGIKIKPETFATLEVVAGGSSSGAKFADFLLQSASEVTQERYQLLETFGDTIGFFYGTRPKIYQYSGVLINTSDYPWRDNWKWQYEEQFRGTKCVETKKRVYLTYDFVLREGYLLGMNIG